MIEYIKVNKGGERIYIYKIDKKDMNERKKRK